MMKGLCFLFIPLLVYSCNGLSVNNKDVNPVPVHIVNGTIQTSAQKSAAAFRAMGAGENDYIIKQANNQYNTSIRYLFVSCKPFSDADSHEVDFIVKDANGNVIFITPLPFADETFSQMVMFNINAGETCELKSTTDRFTFWASGENESIK